jgi:hypothetical protein
MMMSGIDLEMVRLDVEISGLVENQRSVGQREDAEVEETSMIELWDGGGVKGRLVP